VSEEIELVTPEYWEEARKHLTRRDRVMKRLIPQFGTACLQSRGDAFTTLARSIVGQQISVKAAQSVWDRLTACVGEMTPEGVISKPRPELRACGLSDRKTEYIADLAQHFADGRIHVHRWPQMSDEEIIAELVEVRGIGRWTAEMFLIFNLARPDILPLDDLGLQRALSLNYNRGRPLSQRRLRAVTGVWAPWRSVATWYMWRSLEVVPVTPAAKGA
jgi:DNA-3-methyladenine glycosylase II